MTEKEKLFSRLPVALLFSGANWQLIDQWLVSIPLWKYILVELLLLLSMKCYTLVIDKMNLK